MEEPEPPPPSASTTGDNDDAPLSPTAGTSSRKHRRRLAAQRRGKGDDAASRTRGGGGGGGGGWFKKLAEEMEQCLEAGVVDDLSTAPYRRRRLVERNATYSAHGGSRHPQSPSSIGRSRKDSGSPNTKNRTLSPSSLSPERADLQRVGRNIDKAKQQYEQEYSLIRKKMAAAVKRNGRRRQDIPSSSAFEDRSLLGSVQISGATDGNLSDDESLFADFDEVATQAGLVLEDEEIGQESGLGQVQEQEEDDLFVDVGASTGRAEEHAAGHAERILVVRGDSSVREVNLAHHGVGDPLGRAFAGCLEQMSHIESLNISDNRLREGALGPILRAASTIPSLATLNLGSNKLDAEALEALGGFLHKGSCPVKILNMSACQVDDSACCTLVEHLEENFSVEILDLSRNTIGEKEVANSALPDFTTGPEMMAKYLSDVRCALLRVLNLSWNSIQKDSARQLGEALGKNKTLQEIDLSYNAFHDAGGQAVGEMLHRNTSLVKINLANNSISQRAAFTIACGLRHNTTLLELNLRGNPIGDAGGRALMQVAIDTGDHIAVHLEQCSMTLRDPNFSIDGQTHLPKEPCDEPQTQPEAEGGETTIAYRCDLAVPLRRAIALEVLRVVAERPRFIVDKARLGGAAVKLERFTLEGSPEDDRLIRKIDDAENNFDEFWDQYDTNGSQTIDGRELAKLLGDLELPACSGNVERILEFYDVDKGGLLEKFELLEFLEQTKKDVHEHMKPAAVMVEVGQTQPFTLPPASADGGAKNIFELHLSIESERAEAMRITSSMDIEKIMTWARKADDRWLALQHSLHARRLHVEEAREILGEIRREVLISNPIEALSSVVPFMSNSRQAKELVALELKDKATREILSEIRKEETKGRSFVADDFESPGDSTELSEEQLERFREEKMAEIGERIVQGRRELEVRLTPAFKPLMGVYTDHYDLDLSKKNDRLCMAKLIEQNNHESKLNRFHLWNPDTSQSGNWFCFRNEKLNKQRFQMQQAFFDMLPKFGILEFDFVSTVRPSAQISTMTPQRFVATFRKLKWIENDDEVDIVTKMIAKPYGAVKRMDSEELTAFDQEMSVLREDEDNSEAEHEKGRQSNPKAGVDQARALPSVGGGDSASRKRSRRRRLTTRARSNTRLVVKTMDAKEGFARLRDEISTKWFSCNQVQWMVLHCPVFSYKNLSEEWKVDLVVDLHSRVVDLAYFDVVLETLLPWERARAIHRLGWLNCFSPTRPDHLYALDLRQREDRIVAKMLVHLSAVEPGINWVNQTYHPARSSLEDVPASGFSLTTLWYTEDGLPAKGILRLEFYSGEGRGLKYCKPNNQLRALLHSVVLSDELPEHRELLSRATNGGALSRESLVFESLRSKAISWVYDNSSFGGSGAAEEDAGAECMADGESAAKLKAKWLAKATEKTKYGRIAGKLANAPMELLADADFMVEAAAQTYGAALEYASDEIRPKVWKELMERSDGEVAERLRAMWLTRAGREYYGRIAYRLKDAPKELFDDADFMLAAANLTDGAALLYASDETRAKVWAELMADGEFAAKLKAEWLATATEEDKHGRVAYKLEDAPKELLADADFMAAAAAQTDGAALQYAPEERLSSDVDDFRRKACAALADRFLALPKDQQDQEWATSHSSLNAALATSKSTALVLASYLISLADQSLPLSHRAALPPEAFLPEGTPIWQGSDDDGIRGVLVVALSYMWQGADHPDPDGGQLRDVARFLRWLQSTEYKNCTIVVFWDWASLYQDKPEGTRSEEQTLSFKSGLENVNLWYSHDMVISLLNRVKPPERDNEYDESGWPVS